MLFRIVGMLFGLFVWNSNGELRITTAISSPPRNSRTTAILTVPEQQICVWLHRYYSYSENSSYPAILLFSCHPNTPLKNWHLYILFAIFYILYILSKCYLSTMKINICTFIFHFFVFYIFWVSVVMVNIFDYPHPFRLFIYLNYIFLYN
jgi:hypothetical protein